MSKARRWAVVVAMIAWLSPSGVSAQNFYAAIRGGPGWTDDVRRQNALLGDTVLEFETGFTGGAALGYALPFGLRTEAEFGFIYSPLSRHLGQEVDGSVNSYLGMLNAYYDLRIPGLGPFRPYVGGGLGAARVNYDHQVVFTCTVCLLGGPAPKLNVDEWRTAFAWQARGGVIYDVNPWLDLSLGYRYVHVDGGHLGSGPRPTQVKVGPIHNHSVELGFAIKF
jgi:opacity protein-like surface antigen